MNVFDFFIQYRVLGRRHLKSSADTSNLIFSIQPLQLPSDPSQRLWFIHDYGAL